MSLGVNITEENQTVAIFKVVFGGFLCKYILL